MVAQIVEKKICLCKWYTTQICIMLWTRHFDLEYHNMRICIYWTTSATSLKKTPRDYVVASHLLSKWSVTSVYMYAFSGSTQPSHHASNQTNKIGLIWSMWYRIFSFNFIQTCIFFVICYMFKTVTQAFSRFTDKCCTNHLHFLKNKISYINCNKQTVNEAYTSFRRHNIC